MKVQLELYASLMEFLPAGADRHRTEAEVPAGTTPAQLLARYRVPPERAHLVLRNGVFLPPEARDSTPLEAGDVIAAWPPVAGG